MLRAPRRLPPLRSPASSHAPYHTSILYSPSRSPPRPCRRISCSLSCLSGTGASVVRSASCTTSFFISPSSISILGVGALPVWCAVVSCVAGTIGG
ncbi:hypothetical protein BD310DRAFT_152235 [Dichomitus squalens]|uniref:Uncharacterized protein n=1 Tax=Dichomitus squalens TaxID=114155 RepID=A0A4Q9Q407_9APHY|nr:hypothetical protein BD310DRAFT_152235 [Dichomitus squalens]